MGTSWPIPRSLQAFAVALALCTGAAGGAWADPPAGTDTGASAPPQESFFSSLKQAFKQDFDHAVVRGHFDVGTPPDTHRYYCLADVKTGKRQPNGVAGQPVSRPDGMTGIKASAVSLYSCVSAEQQGQLITTGYVLSAAAAGTSTASSPAAPAAAAGPAAAAAPAQTRAPAVPDASPERVDVAGVQLGMSLDEVRAALKSKKLVDYRESSEPLGRPDAAGTAQPSGRFVNVIAAWTRAPSSPRDASGEEGESFEVMFTPVPGKERAMAIVHSVTYSPANGPRETALENGLVKKYGGYTGSRDFPGSPTWRIQSSGDVQVGDACERRGILAGSSSSDGPSVGNATRPNLALKTQPDELRFQVDHCGVAIVTEDHATANGGAPHEDRIITRFTVTAYSPSIGLAGATAAHLIETAGRPLGKAGDPLGKASAPRTKDQPIPNL
ncbi:MAG: hypothetical protein JWN43_4415 [Gammaproteobacteria bacterium]|nr:hypothetical protein [Gammaproteobacteria bacterium]